MRFTPKDKRIEEIFSGRNSYEVPVFQRDFSWAEKQYEDFINDIVKSIDLKFDKDSNKIVYSTDVTDYFFGTILLVGDETKPDVNIPYKVIDGQQRLTTMTLFLSSIKSIIDEHNKEKEISDIYQHDYSDKLIFKYTHSGKSIDKTRLVNKKLNPILPYDILKLSTFDATDEATSNISQENLRNSYQLLLDKLSKKSMLSRLKLSEDFEWNDIEYISLIDLLGKQLLNSTVICIYSTEESSMNVIYQNFNSKGMKLNDVDLIKNKIFEVLEDEYDETSRLWNEIVDTVFEMGEQIKDFFYYFMNARGISVNKTNLFPIFSEHIKEEEYNSFLKICHKYVEYYKIICKPEDKDTVASHENYFNRDDNFILKENLEILNISGYSQCRMAFLSLFNAFENNKIKNKDFKRIIEIVTDYNVLSSIKAAGDGSTTNKMTTIYKNMAVLFNNEVIDMNEAYPQIFEWLNSVKPTKQSIKKSKKVYYSGKKDKSQNDAKARRLTKHILVKLEVKRLKSKNKNTGNKALKPIYDLSIEHIIDKKNKARELYDIGNLTLIEQMEHTNSTNKSDMYSKSRVVLTNELLPKIDTFAIENIQPRHDEILTEYYDLVTKNI